MAHDQGPAVSGADTGGARVVPLPGNAREACVETVWPVALPRHLTVAQLQAVVEQADQLAAVFDAMADAVLVYDTAGRIVRVNAAARELFAFDAQPDYPSRPLAERLARTLTRDVQGRPLRKHQSPHLRGLRGEVFTGAQAMDVLLRTLDGRDLQVNVSGAPVRDHEARIVGSVLILRDVTERRRLEREVATRAGELETIIEAMDDFLSITSHELKTPLTTIRGTIQLVRRRVQRALTEAGTTVGELAAGLDELLARTEDQTARLTRLLNDLLDVSRIRAGRLELLLEECDLGAIVVDCVQAERLAWPARTLAVEVPTEPVSVRADAQRIGQVVTNYLTNALRYSPPDRPVAVSLEREGTEARVRVRDQGPGLDAQQQRQVWNRYGRVAGVVAHDAGGGTAAGLGLGLYISRTIVEQHGGRVGVESTRGQGATFWFTLPLAS